METDVRPVDANALMARFFRKERLVQGAASAAYKDAQKTVAAAPTVSLWPEWRDPAEFSPALKDHQRVSVLWALRGGRRKSAGDWSVNR